MIRLMSIAHFATIFFITIQVATAAWAGESAIKISAVTPYHDPTIIATNIVEECTQLGGKLAKFLNTYATKYGVETELVENADPSGGGRVLVVKITNAISGGNAFLGHRKSMSVKAELFKNGKSVEYVNFTRDSGGGFGGAYKGSCSVLGRCTKALGRDVAKWLSDL